jgi:hypothetical protein
MFLADFAKYLTGEVRGFSCGFALRFRLITYSSFFLSTHLLVLLGKEVVNPLSYNYSLSFFRNSDHLQYRVVQFYSVGQVSRRCLLIIALRSITMHRALGSVQVNVRCKRQPGIYPLARRTIRNHSVQLQSSATIAMLPVIR